MGVLPNGEAGLSPNIGDAFATTADGSIPGQAGNDQPTVEELLKQRVRESTGWNNAHVAAFGELLGDAGSLIQRIFATIGNIFTGMITTGWNNLTEILSTIGDGITHFLGELIPPLDASIIISGQFAQDMVDGLVDDLTAAASAASTALTTSVNTIKNAFNSWFGGTAATGTPVEMADTMASIKSIVQGGWSLEVLTTSGSWTVPNETILEFHAGVFGSGSGGGGGTGGSGGIGGPAGAYVMQEINPTDLGDPGDTISYTVATGGAGAAAGSGVPNNGADSSFGSFVTSAGFTGASVSTLFGFLNADNSQPGDGGDGGDGGGSAMGGEDGQSTPLATGGAGGTVGAGHNGSAGGNADLSGQARAGGAGGGGGAGGNLTPGATAFGGNGANGGFPGGGGGAGGGQGVSASPGAGGNGGHGCVVLLYKLGVDET